MQGEGEVHCHRLRFEPLLSCFRCLIADAFTLGGGALRQRYVARRGRGVARRGRGVAGGGRGVGWTTSY